MLKLNFLSFIFVLCIFQSINLHAQILKRKASLGIALYMTTPDSLLHLTNNNSGALIKKILPGSSALEMGLQELDVITETNDKKINSVAEFLKVINEVREGDALKITVLRNHITKKFDAKATPKAYEVVEGMTIDYGSFAYEKGIVRTIFKSPKGIKTKGIIYFLQGISCYTLDNLKPKDPTKLAIDYLVKSGYAVYTIEKSSVGDNLNITPCESMNYFDEINLFKAGYANLLQQKKIDTSHIFLFGHSLGGLAAPQLAATYAPKGIIVYGTGLKPWSDYLLDANKIQSLYYSYDLADLTDSIEKWKPAFYEYFYGNKSIDEIVQNPEKANALENLLGYNTATKMAMAGRTALFHKQINATNISDAWRKSNCKVLAIYGEGDVAPNNGDDHIALVKYVNQLRPNTATFMLAKETNHTFQRIGNIARYIELQKDEAAYQKLAEENFNTALFDDIIVWLNKQ